MDSLKKINFWKQKIDWKPAHSAQSVLGKKPAGRKKASADSPCGQGSCNCGGGCNGECGSCH